MQELKAIILRCHILLGHYLEPRLVLSTKEQAICALIICTLPFSVEKNAVHTQRLTRNYFKVRDIYRVDNILTWVLDLARKSTSTHRKLKNIGSWASKRKQIRSSEQESSELFRSNLPQDKTLCHWSFTPCLHVVTGHDPQPHTVPELLVTFCTISRALQWPACDVSRSSNIRWATRW